MRASACILPCAVLGALLGVLLASVSARAGGKAVDGAVNLNTAPPEILSLLPGVGPAKAQSILAYRKRHPFRTVDELVRIKGIGRKMVRRLRAHLAVGGPTTATPAVAPASPPVPPPPPPKRAPTPVVCARPLHPPRPPSRPPMPTHGTCPRAP